MFKERAIFLDRDGVINRAIIKNNKPYAANSLKELEVPEDVPTILQSFKKAGFLLIGITNQPDVARGQVQQSSVELINQTLLQQLPLQEIFVCYHDDVDECSCRKPKPGLLIKAAERYNIDLSQSYMIGDRWRDVEAGQGAGCKAIWINCGYNEPGPTRQPDFTVSSLLEASNWILN